MNKTISIVKENQPNISEEIVELVKKDMIFRKIQRDTIGRSSSNPTWGYAYSVENGGLKFKGEALYKEHDYDLPNAAYSEKVTSIMGQKLLTNVRVPEIDIVEESKGDPGVISYKILNNDREDMFHIRDILYHKYERNILETKKDIFALSDILECVKIQVNNNENYRYLEKNIIHTLLFDSITNNGDRHCNNWSLVRNKDSDWYELAIFDHASSFVNMFKDQKHFTCNGWVSSYTTVGEEENSKLRTGSLGKKIIEYVYENYRSYFEEFATDFHNKLPMIMELIKRENLPIDVRLLEKRLKERDSFLRKMYIREEMEHE